MWKRMLIGLGGASAVGAAIAVGVMAQIVFEADRVAPANEEAAIAVARSLSGTWRVDRITAVATPEYAATLAGSDLQAALDDLSVLGVFRSAEEVSQTSYRKRLDVSRGVVVVSTVSYLAVFSKGRARVEVVLEVDDTGHRIQSLRIDPVEGAAPRRASAVV